MSQLALFVPSRGRPDNIEALCKSLRDCESNRTRLFVVIDDDDPSFSSYVKLANWNDFELEVVKSTRRGMAQPLNLAVRRYIKDFDYFAFMGDDHRPRTKHWDWNLIEALLDSDGGIAYGNDLHAGESLPTACALYWDIVEKLHGMVPDTFIHLYIDNFWLKLGQDLGMITYLENTVIEHCHPFFGTGEMDALYEEINDPRIYSADKTAFDSYIQSDEYAQLVEACK